MILKIKTWCEGIIVAIIISIIIEMLIPEGNNKKYVKVVIGIYIMFVVLNPILEMLNYQFDFNNFLKIETKEAYSLIDTDMRDVYLVGIEESIKMDLEELGYIVKNVDVFVDINYENIEKIEIKVEKKSKNIEPIVIGEKSKENKSDSDYSDILDYFKENYFLEKDKIIFN